jgi:hypothetical protein
MRIDIIIECSSRWIEEAPGGNLALVMRTGEYTNLAHDDPMQCDLN